MRPDEAHRALQTGMTGPATERIFETARLTRDAVASRPAGVSQDDLISPLPAELADYIRALQASPAAGPMFAEGWQVQLVDLTRVCACRATRCWRAMDFATVFSLTFHPAMAKSR
jgi:hypothetical protein